MNREKAFTLIELMLVVLMLGSVMMVILACFDGGFRVYSRVSAFGTGEADVYLAGTILERDLRNAMLLESMAFQGTRESVAFATVLHEGSGPGRPAGVSYTWVPDKGIVRSVAFCVPGGGGQRADAVEETLLAGDYRLGFSYLSRGTGSTADGSITGFMDHWPEGTNLPVAIRLEIDGGSLAEGPLIRTFPVSAPVEGGEER